MEKTTSNDMFKLIEQWQISGKKQNDFFREYNIGIHKFYYWLKKYRSMNTPGGFAPLKVTKGRYSVSQIGIDIEIRYSNGTAIHLPATTNLAIIRQLIRM